MKLSKELERKKQESNWIEWENYITWNNAYKRAWVAGSRLDVQISTSSYIYREACQDLENSKSVDNSVYMWLNVDNSRICRRVLSMLEIYRTFQNYTKLAYLGTWSWAPFFFFFSFLKLGGQVVWF